MKFKNGWNQLAILPLSLSLASIVLIKKGLYQEQFETFLRDGPPFTIDAFKSIWVAFQLISSYINILSALNWQASLNLSLNSQIKVDTIKSTSFEVILVMLELG